MIKHWLKSVGRFLLDYWYLYASYLVTALALTWTVSLRGADSAITTDVLQWCGFLLILISVVFFRRWYRASQLLDQLLVEKHLNELPQLPQTSSLSLKYQQLLAKQVRTYEDLSRDKNEQRQDLEDYYATWVHQIKVPLSVLDLMNQTDTVNPRQSQQQLFMVNHYLEMMLQYIRLQNFNQDLRYNQVAVRPLIVESIKNYKYWFIQKDLEVHLNNDDFSIATDAKWISFVIEQILFNAIKYTNEGHIRIDCDAQNSQIIIEDTGIGIAKDDLPLIFERGYTGFNGRLTNNASGLGLYLVQQILSKLGHSITITSTIDVGTRVIINLKQGH